MHVALYFHKFFILIRLLKLASSYFHDDNINLLQITENSPLLRNTELLKKPKSHEIEYNKSHYL